MIREIYKPTVQQVTRGHFSHGHIVDGYIGEFLAVPIPGAMHHMAASPPDKFKYILGNTRNDRPFAVGQWIERLTVPGVNPQVPSPLQVGVTGRTECDFTAVCRGEPADDGDSGRRAGCVGRSVRQLGENNAENQCVGSLRIAFKK